MHLVLTHTKYHVLETVRIPIAVIGAGLFPVAAMIFFVVPFAGREPAVATSATASMVTLAVMMSCLFQYGVGVAEDRVQHWDSYVRTLPAGAWPRFAGRILNGLFFVAISLAPVMLVAAVATEATITPLRLVAALVATVVIVVPFTFIGLAIGYALPPKAALAVAQLLFFPLALGGGLMSAPGQAPAFVEAIAPFLPTRGAVELMWAAVGHFRVNPIALISLAGWIAGSAALALWGYRRDEGRRFS